MTRVNLASLQYPVEANDVVATAAVAVDDVAAAVVVVVVAVVYWPKL